MERPSLLPRSRSTSRGFTLLELMVALSAGVAVGLGAMVLARNSTKFFQSEARITAAQVSATLGLNRLVSDLQRAAYLGTPHITKDPSTCGTSAGWPAGLLRLSAITILKRGSVVANGSQLDQSVANGFFPDSVVIGGAFETTEQFPVRTIQPGVGGGLSVHLQTNSGAIQRSLANAAQGGALLNDIFRAGRFLRITDADGKHEYGVISGIQITGTPPSQVVVQLANNPMPQNHQGNTCGWTGLGVGMLANPVSRVRYDIRRIAANDPCFGEITRRRADSNLLTGEDGRTELVRVELDENNAEIDATRELVAEFAVDLKFGLTTATAGAAPAVDQRLPINNPENDNIYLIAGDITTGLASPERISGIQVRLTTRARAPDRAVDLGAGADGRKFRFRIDTGAPVPYFARLRTLYADVALPNMTGVSW